MATQVWKTPTYLSADYLKPTSPTITTTAEPYCTRPPTGHFHDWYTHHHSHLPPVPQSDGSQSCEARLALWQTLLGLHEVSTLPGHTYDLSTTNRAITVSADYTPLDIPFPPLLNRRHSRADLSGGYGATGRVSYINRDFSDLRWLQEGESEGDERPSYWIND